jgi:hypothetical protein
MNTLFRRKLTCESKLSPNGTAVAKTGRDVEADRMNIEFDERNHG